MHLQISVLSVKEEKPLIYFNECSTIQLHILHCFFYKQKKTFVRLSSLSPIKKASHSMLLYRCVWYCFHTFVVPKQGKIILGPQCSANPIMVTSIWKWEFENKEHPIRGLYMIFFEKFLFKFPFSHKRFQMGQKMYFYQLYKL